MRSDALILCGATDECERLALRGFDAVLPAPDAATSELATHRGRRVRVTPTGRRKRYGVAAQLCALQCDVRELPAAFDVDHDDPLTAAAVPMWPQQAAEEPRSWPEPLDLQALGEYQPRPPQHIIEGWLPAGEVTLFAGHGGGGKSLVALYLAVCVALGRSPWGGLATEQRHVTVVSAEDNAEVEIWRLHWICAHLGVPLSRLAGVLDVLDWSHLDAELMVDVPHADAMLTAAYDELRATIDPAGLLVLDGASDLYGASEIVRRQVRRFIRALRRLLDPAGAALLLAHVDKVAARDSTTTDRYSGSTAWHNSVRARWSLASESDSPDLVLTLAKANYAQAGSQVHLRWNADAHLYLPEAATDGGIVAEIRERRERRDILRAFASCQAAGVYVPAAIVGRRTSWHVLSQRAEFPASLEHEDRTTRARFLRHIEALRHTALISTGTVRRSNRHETEIFVLTAEGCAECAES